MSDPRKKGKELSDQLARVIESNNHISSHARDLQYKLAEAAKRIDTLESNLIEIAKYGYNYHVSTSFPKMEFDENCLNNFLQRLMGTCGFTYERVMELKDHYLGSLDDVACECDFCANHDKFKWATIQECGCACHSENHDIVGHDSLCCSYPNGKWIDCPYDNLGPAISYEQNPDNEPV